MTRSMRFFLFAGCLGIFLAAFGVQVLPGVPLIYLAGLVMMGAGALGCVLISLPRLLSPRNTRFHDAALDRAVHFNPGTSANRNAAPMTERPLKQMAR